MKRKKRNLTADKLRELLRYEPETGLFFWLVDRKSNKMAGKPAGSMSDGRWRIMIDDESFYANQLAWLWMTGEWAPHLIDHENADKSDDRWDNLRPATKSQNGANRRVLKETAAGKKGVTCQPYGRFQARIRRDGKSIHLGMFATAEEAHAAYASAAKELFGEFARAA